MIAARIAPTLALAGCLSGMLGSDALRTAAALSPAWFPETWPFPADRWGEGRAFWCRSCAGNIKFYVRAKGALRNCSAGIADDDEIERVSDLRLIGAQSSPRGAGNRIMVGWMRGRSRAFQIDNANRPRRFAVTVALANKCDAIVATIVSDEPVSDDTRRSALFFLESDPLIAESGRTRGTR